MPFNGNNWNWDKKISYQEIMLQIDEKYGFYMALISTILVGNSQAMGESVIVGNK